MKLRMLSFDRVSAGVRWTWGVALLVVYSQTQTLVCVGQDDPPAAVAVSESERLLEWPQLKGNSGFTGLSADDSVKPPLKLLWSYRLDGDASGDAGSGVVVAGGKVFASVANSHSVVALDAEDGRFCWEHRSDSIGQIGYLGHAPVPAYHDGRVILWHKRETSAVTALDAQTGLVQWRRPLSPHGIDLNRGGLPIADGMVYCSEGGPEPTISALDVKTGDPVWRTPLGADAGEYAIGPTVAGGRVFVSTRANTRRGPKPDNYRGAVTALDAKTGEILWRRKNVYSWSPMASDGDVLACPMWSSPDEKLYLLDCDTGDTIWAKTRVANHFNPPITFTKDLILYQPWGPKLHAMSRATGEEQWVFHNEFTSAGCCTPAVSGKYAYIGTSVPVKTGDVESLRGFRLANDPSTTGKYGTVNAVDLTTGKSVWKFPTTNTVCGDPAIAYGRLYFASRDGRVYCCVPAAAEEPMTPEAVDQSSPASAAEIGKLLSESTDEDVLPADWPMLGGGPERIGAREAAPSLPLRLAWKFDTGGRVLSSSAVVDGVVYSGSESGVLFAVDADSGESLWQYDTGGRIKCSPAVAGNVVYCGSDSGSFYALDARSGRLIWQYRTGGPIQASPAVFGGAVIFGANDHNLYALNRRTGRKLWSFRTDSFCVQAPPVIRGDHVYAAGWADWVWCLDLKTGRPVWKSFIPVSIEAVSWYRDRLWIRSPYYVVRLDPKNGTWLNIAEASYGYGGLAFVGNRLYQSGVQGQYGTEGATFVSIDGEISPPPEQVAPTLQGVGMLTPQPIQEAVKLESMGAPLGLGDRLCFATLDGNVVVTDRDGERLWQHKLGGPSHASPAFAGGLVVVGCDDGNLYAFRERPSAE